MAIGKSPEYGLDGALGICVTPLTEDWYDVSLMGKIEEAYAWNTVYVSYIFPRTSELYTGFIEFSTTSETVSTFTFGG